MTRFYRNVVKASGLRSYSVKFKETDLQILAETDVRDEALRIVKQLHAQLNRYIATHPEFKTSLVPVEADVSGAPEIVRMMTTAGMAAGTGPMAAVAGAIAEFVGKKLLRKSFELIVENGGDIFIRSRFKRTVGVYAGSSPLSMKLGLRLEPAPEGIGVCTSSATVGHSLSLGKADAVLIIAESPALADAVATATCNRVTLPSTLEGALNFATSIPGVMGALIVLGNRVATSGKAFELVQLD
ncbi:UPF0280 family protein [Candidatus Sumerlaeota bacterium]|nr:UPF0280 family protein [Candidatus Sumerlaeota bacterium]